MRTVGGGRQGGGARRRTRGRAGCAFGPHGARRALRAHGGPSAPERRMGALGRRGALSPTRSAPSAPMAHGRTVDHIDLIAARMEQARFERGIPVAGACPPRGGRPQEARAHPQRRARHESRRVREAVRRVEAGTGEIRSHPQRSVSSDWLIEATNSVGPENEYPITKGIREPVRGKTFGTNIHRVSTVSDAVQVIDMSFSASRSADRMILSCGKAESTGTSSECAKRLPAGSRRGSNAEA